MSDMDDIIKEFLIESQENLDQLDRDLVSLEKDPQSPELLANIFRTIHTIKGTSGFLALEKLGAVAHAGENLLSRLREKQLLLNPEITSALLATVDAVRQMLASIEATGQDGQEPYRDLVARLTALQEVNPEEPLRVGELLVKARNAVPEQVQTAPTQQEEGDSRRLGEILVDQGVATPVEVAAALQEQKEGRFSTTVEGNIRVDVSLLDKLMNLVGELVLARNQILQYSTNHQDTSFLNTSQRLNLITTELQEGVMKTRMQPIGNIWSRFPRVVRDLALSCGKQVRVEMEGKETDLDKTIVEAIKDPLTHIVRNSVDHGIESPEERRAKGKPAEGRLFLRAFHEGGQVNIEISDDGAGIDQEKVRQKALEHGLITPEQSSRMSERELLNLVFLPGFSTAGKVTNVSGRGVGMDVVKTNIEKIGGVVDLQSKTGEGTTLKIKIPLTLAIIPALTVTTGGDRYAIPQVSLLELVRLEGEEARKSVETIHGVPVYRLRGRLLPLVYLRRELQIQDEGTFQTGNMDFAEAKRKHTAWLVRLRSVLDGKLAMTAEMVGNQTECAVGQWLYASALGRFKDVVEIHTLEKVHADFHAKVKQVVINKAAGKNFEAESQLSALSSLSARIIELLITAEKKMLSSQAANIVVLQADDRQFGLVVDEINDTEEIVVKPLGKVLKGLSCYAGATIMGDGQVALILDVLGLGQKARVVIEARERTVAERVQASKQAGGSRQSLLLLQSVSGGRMAVPLESVSRLEELEPNSPEWIGGREVVQYRGKIMPLVRLNEALPEGRLAESHREAKLQVVVYSQGGGNVGLIVEKILDVVDAEGKVQHRAVRSGTRGSMVIQGRVTELLDVQQILSGVDSNFGAQISETEARA
jgi:chemotaxis protein histidine kinase CheA